MEATTEYIGNYSVPNGYFGDRTIVHVVFDHTDNKLLDVHHHGFHHSSFLQMDIQDAAEAKWLIENHPNGRKYYH